MGGTDSSGGMYPAGQRLRTDNCSRFQIDLGLVVKSNFVPFKGMPQILLEGWGSFCLIVPIGINVSVVMGSSSPGDIGGCVCIIKLGFVSLPSG